MSDIGNHLAPILAGMILGRAMFELMFSKRDRVTGAVYTVVGVAALVVFLVFREG